MGKERPILFNTEMVRAILEGRKTQTRRLVKPGDPTWTYSVVDDGEEGVAWLWEADASGQWLKAQSPLGLPGDKLWVRESGYEPPMLTARMLREGADTWPDFMYAADVGFDRDWCRQNGWISRPSIHMKRKFSRITLEVKSVRVERVQSIDEAGAKAEGVRGVAGTDGVCVYRDSFVRLWSDLYAKDGFGWDVNPWVWVVEFDANVR